MKNVDTALLLGGADKSSMLDSWCGSTHALHLLLIELLAVRRDFRDFTNALTTDGKSLRNTDEVRADLGPDMIGDSVADRNRFSLQYKSSKLKILE